MIFEIYLEIILFYLLKINRILFIFVIIYWVLNFLLKFLFMINSLLKIWICDYSVEISENIIDDLGYFLYKRQCYWWFLLFFEFNGIIRSVFINSWFLKFSSEYVFIRYSVLEFSVCEYLVMVLDNVIGDFCYFFDMHMIK